MKKIIKLNLMILLTIAMLIILSTNSNAASAKINANDEVEVGTPINISVTGSGVQWNLKLIVNGQEIANDSELENYQSNISISFSKSYTPTSTGSLKIELQGSVTEYNDGSTITTFASKTVTVKEKSTPQTSGGNSGTSTGGSTGSGSGTTTTTPTEPKFTDVSKTVYATTNINLRSSWSTSSSATKVQKGTELRLTGTSTEKINGYVWYRVTYNGQIKYVSKDLITETKPEEKSNNANLKSLAIEGAELTPTFSASVTEYSAKLVNYKENTLNITAEAEDEKTTVKITGNEQIEVGENAILITATAEDGTTKIYTITVTNEEVEPLGLLSLKIKDIEIKDFSPSKFDYAIEFKELDKLDIEAIANKEDATVEILGNEGLIEGKNIITIIVTSADGEEIATYQITANKLAVIEQKQELNIKSIVISALIALVVLIAIIILIVKYVKKNDNLEIDYIYTDNLEEQESENTIEENETKEEKEETQDEKEEAPIESKIEIEETIDEELPRKRGKGKHSK